MAVTFNVNEWYMMHTSNSKLLGRPLNASKWNGRVPEPGWWVELVDAVELFSGVEVGPSGIQQRFMLVPFENLLSPARIVVIPTLIVALSDLSAEDKKVYEMNLSAVLSNREKARIRAGTGLKL